MHLVSVPESLVLLVRQVGPHLLAHESLLRLLAHVVALLVGPVVVNEQQEGRQSTASLSPHDGELGRTVLGRVACLEGLRADDVAKGEASADEGEGEGAFGCTTKVGSGPLIVR